jgi:hypothetical protein
MPLREPDAKPAAAAQTLSTSGAPPPAAVDVGKDAELDMQIKRLRSQGYRPKVVGGTTVYCRSEPVLGSRFERQLCGTVEDLVKATQTSKDAVDSIQRRSQMLSRDK